MDFSKLSANERMATFAAIALIIAGIISNWGGLMWLSVIAGVLALVVIFLPQLSPQTNLPGSAGSLLVAMGGIAAAGAVIELLRFLGYFFRTLDDWQTWAFAIALVAALVLAWTAWKMFQAEGGNFRFGTQSSGTNEAAMAPPPAATPPPPAPPAASPPPAPPATPPAAPMAGGTEMHDHDPDEEHDPTA